MCDACGVCGGDYTTCTSSPIVVHYGSDETRKSMNTMTLFKIKTYCFIAVVVSILSVLGFAVVCCVVLGYLSRNSLVPTMKNLYETNIITRKWRQNRGYNKAHNKFSKTLTFDVDNEATFIEENNTINSTAAIE